MTFFFTKDYRHKFRYFSSEPVHQIQVEFSRLKKILSKAKEKLMLLPKRILAQEQAFERINEIKELDIYVLYSGRMDKKKINSKFYYFLQRQRSKHVLFLIGESVLLPISGLMALLPGPNVFFGVLALILFTHWQGLKGVNRLLKKEIRFIPSKHLEEWEQAVESKDEGKFPSILEKIAKEHNLHSIPKILYK